MGEDDNDGKDNDSEDNCNVASMTSKDSEDNRQGR
jgi:hypothetical protein